MRRCSSEIPFREIMVDGLGETSRCVVGKALSVRFEGVLECVGHVVGFAELGALDCSCLNVVVQKQERKGKRGRGKGRLTFSYAIPASR